MMNILKLLSLSIVLTSSLYGWQIDVKEIEYQLKVDHCFSMDTTDFYSDLYLTHIDAEELCEFNFDFFLPELNQKLNQVGLELVIRIPSDYEDSFEIEINGERLQLFTDEEIASGRFWDSGPRNFFRRVNKILKEHNSNKRFYLLYGGNDLIALWLTESEFMLMSSENRNDKDEIPYHP